MRLTTPLSQFFPIFFTYSAMFSNSYLTLILSTLQFCSHTLQSHSSLNPISKSSFPFIILYTSTFFSLNPTLYSPLIYTSNFLYPVLLFLLTYPQFSLILKYFITLIPHTFNPILIFY